MKQAAIFLMIRRGIMYHHGSVPQDEITNGRYLAGPRFPITQGIRNVVVGEHRKERPPVRTMPQDRTVRSECREQRGCFVWKRRVAGIEADGRHKISRRTGRSL